VEEPAIILSSKRSRLAYGLTDEESSLVKSLQDAGHKVGGEPPALVKSVLGILNGPNNSAPERLAYEEDPSRVNRFAGLYKAKLRLLPDDLLKRIAIQDDLVATIVRARQNQVGAFGRPRPDRWSTGYTIEPHQGLAAKLDADGKAKLNEQCAAAIKKLWTCGSTDGWGGSEQLTFAEYLSMSTRNAIVSGRISTEAIYTEGVFHSFRVTDAGTIFQAVRNQEAGDRLRLDAVKLLRELRGDEHDPDKFDRNVLDPASVESDEDYEWIQVVSGTPREAFTGREMLVKNFYEVPDIELGGYPVTPLDTVISAVTTHISISTHNRLYFQSGRATRGMLVIKSDDAEPATINGIKHQFNASINNVSNSWRMPVFGCSKNEEIQWQQLDTGGGRDAEFQYLTDMNARVILSAFMMAPEELTAFGYLSRGTNNQALSEGNNEYKLEAARDLGIRPLLARFEDFVNAELMPLIDADLAAKARFRFVGLDADNAEKEATRIEQDAQLHMCYDDILEQVEKPVVGADFGGKIPLNPVFKAVLDQYFTVGEILERFCGIKGAAKDPQLAYRRDTFWMTWWQAQQQMQAAQQQAAAQAQGQGGPPQGGGGAPPGAPGDGQAGQSSTEKQKSEASSAGGDAGGGAGGSAGGDALARSIDQALDSLSKNEANLPPDARRLLARQNRALSFISKGWDDAAKEAVREILAVAEVHKPS
jgi:hypothetical protein